MYLEHEHIFQQSVPCNYITVNGSLRLHVVGRVIYMYYSQIKGFTVTFYRGHMDKTFKTLKHFISKVIRYYVMF